MRVLIPITMWLRDVARAGEEIQPDLVRLVSERCRPTLIPPANPPFDT